MGSYWQEVQVCSACDVPDTLQEPNTLKRAALARPQTHQDGLCWP